MDTIELKNKRVLDAAWGKKVDRLPVWVMRQAGRYLPEFRELRKKHSFFEICQSPALACETTLMPIKRFALDAAIIFSDILVVPQALGLNVEMVEAIGPVLPQPLTLDDVANLQVDGANERLKYVADAIRETRQHLNGAVPLFGFCGAPWTLMCYMVEGRGSKTMSKAKRWLYAHSETAHRLLDTLTTVLIEYLIAQVEGGADILQVFDSSAEYLNHELYTTFALPGLRKIRAGVADGLRKRGLAPVPMVLFAKGAHFCLREQAELGYEVVGVDWTVSPKHARALVGDKVTLQGNLDPCALYASDEELERMVKKMVEEFGGPERLIVNLGHGIYPDMTPEAVDAFVRIVHNIPV